MPADTRLWHAFADMHAVRGHEFVIARGDGAYVWDEEGNRYLDGTASLWCVNVGHGRDEIVEAAMAQMRVLASYQTFGAFANRPALDLAERLADLAPLDDPRIFLGSGGGDAIDTAAKLARRYFAAIGTPERTHLISRSQGYHGTHGMGTSIGGIPANRMDVGPLDPDASVVPYDSLEALEARDRARRRRSRRGGLRRAGHRRRRGAPAARPATSRASPSCARARACSSSATRSSPASGAWGPGSASSAGACAPTC